MKTPIKVVVFGLSIVLHFGTGFQHVKLSNYNNRDKIKDRYIVKLKDTSSGSTASPIAAKAKLLSVPGIESEEVRAEYDLSDFGIHIVPATITSTKALLNVLNLPEVELVEADVKIHRSACSSQTGASWSLNRMSGRNQTAATFDHEAASHNVTIYVMDTGVNIAHQEFGGRAIFGTCVYVSANPQQDMGNHGTGAASCAAGSTIGVAKSATIVSVRIFSDLGSSSTLASLYGYSWVLNHHYNKSLRLNPTLTQSQQHKVNFATPSFVRPRSVINMSYGSLGFSTTLDSVLELLRDYGMISVTSAGNFNADACLYFPQGSSQVISVGCSNSTNHLCSFSNYGKCVHVLAPGELVPVAQNTSTTATALTSGTSFSSPYVAGVIANYVSNLTSMPTPDERHQHHKDRGVVQNAWCKVAEGVGGSIEDCQQRWSTIRTRYVRERRTKAPPSGSAASDRQTSSWILYPQMSFLSPYVSFRITKTNFKIKVVKATTDLTDGDISQPEVEDEERDEQEAEGEQEREETQEEEVPREASPAPDTEGGVPVDKQITPPARQTPAIPQRRPRKAPKRKIGTKTKEDEVLDLMKAELTNKETEEELFGLMVAKRLAKMPESTKMNCMLAMQQVLLQYSLSSTMPAQIPPPISSHVHVDLPQTQPAAYMYQPPVPPSTEPSMHGFESSYRSMLEM